MIAKPIFLAGMLMFGFDAAARAAVGESGHPAGRQPAADTRIQLAQGREVEIYYDQYGREVLVDAYTGEVIAIRERRERRFEQAPPRGLPQPAPEQDRYYLDNLEDVARLRRLKRMEDLGRIEPPQGQVPEYREFRQLPQPDPGYSYPEEDFAREEPGYNEPWYEEEAPGARRVERSPLGQPPIGQPPVGQPPVGQLPSTQPPLNQPPLAELPPQVQPGSIIEDTPPTGALPDVTQAPEITHGGASEDVAKIQILLDRMGASPGVIDGRMGDNVNKAISAYRDLTGQALRTYDKAAIDQALADSGGDPFTTYEITAVDAAGPFVASVPTDYGEKAQLERMSYTSVIEMLAERFHMDEKYLVALNPGLDFNRPGTIVKVANVSAKRTGKVARIVAHKGQRQVRAYDATGKLIVVYPSTIGSAATPSPSGTHTVERIALMPEYTYNPKINFKQGENDRVLTIPPGPNGPVGSVWIALSKPTYGIHGTPDPSKIGKTESNGCIRLTNWDAEELAKMVEKGVTVEFIE